MLQPDFHPAPTTLRIHRCKYISRCKKRSCPEHATLIAQKVDGAGRHIRQIELGARHCEIVIERERLPGLEIWDRRNDEVRIAARASNPGKRTGQRADLFTLTSPNTNW